MTPRFLLLLTAASTAFACGRVHALKDGAYQFQLVSTIRDDCNLAGKPEILTTGSLRSSGDKVTLDYGLFGLRLVGSYLADDPSKVERMRLDGSATNVPTNLNGTECVIDLAALHIDGTTLDPRQFEGTFSLKLDSNRNTACVCEFWFDYLATGQ